MSRRLQVRLPAPDLIERYQREGLWISRTLAQELEAGLLRMPAVRYKVWSDVRPFEGSWGEIHARARRVARAFIELGVQPGDIISFQLPNWIEAIETFLATMFVGGVSMPIVQFYGHRELRFVLGQTAARLHVTTSRFRSLDYRATMDELRPELPSLEHVLYVDEDWSEVLRHEPLQSIHQGDPDEPAIIAFTSGTTADPKGVIHTSRTTLAEIRQRHHAAPGDPRPAPLNPPVGFDEWLVASPIGHVSGLQTAVLLPFLLGRRANSIDRWDVDAVLDALTQGGLFLGAAANFFFNSILNHAKFRTEHLKHLRYVVSGGAPVPRAFGEQCEALGITLVRGYGSTEHPTATGSAFDDPVEKRIGTDGRIVAGVDVEVRDATGQIAAVGQRGEIYTRGPDMFVGYVDTTLNEAAFDAAGWFCTGDVGVMDGDGYLTITDRTKDIIIRGGENISAVEVEEALCRIGSVLEAAAVAAPDARMGEHVCAVLRIVQGGTPPTLDDVRSELRGIGLTRQKWPEELWIIDDFDRTASGKIKKFALREKLWKQSGDLVADAEHRDRAFEERK
jgi:acyl-CoA synthetase